MIDRPTQHFSNILENAGFRNFTIQETNKPTNLLMTNDQEIQQLKINFNKLQIRFTNAKQAYLDMRAERDEYKLLLEAKHTDNKTKPKKPKAKQPTDTNTDIVERIYEQYPKKTNRKGALTAISKAITELKRNTGGTADNMLSIVTQFRQELERYDINPRHEKWASVPHATTWFNQARYELEPAEWTAMFRDGKYTTPEKTNTTPDEPEHWKKVIKVMYPDCLEHSLVWDTWYVSYPDLVQELRENYNRIVRELGL